MNIQWQPVRDYAIDEATGVGLWESVPVSDSAAAVHEDVADDGDGGCGDVGATKPPKRDDEEAQLQRSLGMRGGGFVEPIDDEIQDDLRQVLQERRGW